MSDYPDKLVTYKNSYLIMKMYRSTHVCFDIYFTSMKQIYI